MSPTTQGALVLVVTLVMLVSGIPVAFGLGVVAISFLVFFQGFDALHVVAETFWSGLDDFTLVAIPMFVMMGAAIGSSPAGKDLYERSTAGSIVCRAASSFQTWAPAQ